MKFAKINYSFLLIFYWQECIIKEDKVKPKTYLNKK